MEGKKSSKLLSPVSVMRTVWPEGTWYSAISQSRGIRVGSSGLRSVEKTMNSPFPEMRFVTTARKRAPRGESERVDGNQKEATRGEGVRTDLD